MNPLTRWNELRWCQLDELEDLRHRLGSLYRRFRVRWPKDGKGRVGVAPSDPGADTSEDAHGYLIKTGLPQVNKEDVKVTLGDGTLTISVNPTEAHQDNPIRSHYYCSSGWGIDE